MNTTEKTHYLLRFEDGYEEYITATSLADAREQARIFVLGGEWDTYHGTIWCRVHILEITKDEDGDECTEEVDSILVDVDPPEPDCLRGHEHKWESPYEVVGGCKSNPGVWGHGGGVIITTVCEHCGAYQDYDTWAQNPETGEQGLDSVAYREADSDSQAWVDSLCEVSYEWDEFSTGPLQNRNVFLRCNARQGTREASALWIVTRNSYNLSDNGHDTDTPLDADEEWPEPPATVLASAREWFELIS